MPSPPFGIKYCKILNYINIFMFISAGVLMSMIAVPNFLKAAQAAGKTANPFLLIIVGFVCPAIASIPCIFLMWLNKGLSRFDNKARIFQIIISLIGLLAFPVGTILYAVSLYFMLFDKNTKQLFSK